MDWVAEHVCTKCGATLLIEIFDLEISGGRFFVSCAVCRNWEYPTQTLPWYVMRCAKGEFVGWPPDHPLQGKRKR